MSTFDVGDVVTLDFTVTLDGVATDPTLVTLVITNPAGVATSPTPAHPGVGRYTWDQAATVAGVWTYQWTALGAAQAAEAGSFTVHVPAAPLVTLAQVRDVLNIPAGDMSHDAELQRYIDAATATVTYITGPLTPTTFTEVRDGGSPVIMLDNPPVQSVTSVVEYYTPGGQALSLQPLGSSSNAYGYDLADPASGKLVRRTAGGFQSNFVGGRNSVVITYVAGASTIAADVVMAALEDIRGLYQQTQQGGRVGGGTIGAGGDDQWTAGPMRLFPRLAMLLEGPNRTQSIA